MEHFDETSTMIRIVLPILLGCHATVAEYAWWLHATRGGDGGTPLGARYSACLAASEPRGPGDAIEL